MHIDRRLIAAIFMLSLPLLTGNAYGDSRYQWDLVRLSLTGGVTLTINGGGIASALAEDGSMITLTGSGTFTVGDEGVTGGGTWKTVAADGVTVTGMGNFLVTRLIRFVVAPGLLPAGAIDTIGTPANAHSGLVHLRIDYDDGSKGILIVSCHQPVGSPSTLFEGITASKGFVDYWNHLEPVGTPATANAGRTLFHLLSAERN
ncbi:MAG: hypothetical protein E6K32_01190 [Gammaproteobacteria bacterium]|nr:MAG: hypothetical protein E6K32_01190 [Gammaproteobacteria bacterium]